MPLRHQCRSALRRDAATTSWRRTGRTREGKLLNTYLTETWERPTDCIARDVDGNPLTNPEDEQVLPIGPGKGCLEGPLMGVQFGTYATDQGTPDANFGAAVDGNYGFGDGCYTGTLDATDPSAPVCNGGTFEALAAGRLPGPRRDPD